MKYRLNKSKVRSTKTKLIITARWFSYGLILLLFYAMSVNSLVLFTPPLLLPLASAVALFEKELSSGIFAAFCGFFIDMGSDRLFGFTSFWLVILCVGISLISSHAVKANLFNYLWLNAVFCVLVALIDLLFYYWLFHRESTSTTLMAYMVPAYSLAILLSALIYFAVRKIHLIFSSKEILTLEEAAHDAGEASQSSTRV